MILSYIYFELKKGLCILAGSFLRLIGTVVILALISGGFVWMLGSTSVLPRMTIGVSASSEDMATSMLLRYIESLPSVSSICEFKYMSQEEVQKGLSNDSLFGGIILEEGFYEAVDAGEIPPTEIIIREDGSNRGILFAELLGDGISLVRTTEAGLYVTYEIIDEHGGADKGQVGTELLGEHVMSILGRDNTFKSELISPFGTISSEKFILLGINVFLLLLCGIGASGFYRQESRILERLLPLYGLGSFVTLMVRLLVMTILLFIVQGCFYGAAAGLSGAFDLDLVVFSPESFLYMIPACFCLAAFFNLIYSIVKDERIGERVIFWLSVIMGVCSGLLIPSSFLPGPVSEIGSRLPVFLITDQVRAALFGGGGINSLYCIFAALIMLAVGGVISWRTS